MRREDGTAAVEFAVVGGLLLLLATGLLPILQAVLAYNDLSRATAEALRYATHAEPNPRPAPPECRVSGEAEQWTRWPSTAEVTSALESSLGRPVAVTVGPDEPCRVRFSANRSDMIITVRASVEHDLGPLAALANGISGLFGQTGPFPNDAITISATAAGLKE